MGGVFTDLPPGLNEVDVIIAGGGTAGCVVAARLSDADPELSILVIEGGKNNYNDPAVTTPLLLLSHLAPTSTSMIHYKTARESQLANREIVVPCGGILGGGSSVNVMMYSRALREDYDSWETPGWTADDMIPFLKKLETYTGLGSPDIHGDSGPIQVSPGSYRAIRAQEELLRAAASVGWPEVVDLTDLKTSHGVTRLPRYTSPEGVRQDAAHRYLHPRLRDDNHPNLKVLVEHQIVRVLFDENQKAVGVEFQPNPLHRGPAGSALTLQSVKARKAVVLSSGSLGTPAILERSGVGDPEVLGRAGVEVITNLPGVGRDFQDHQLVNSSYKTNLPLEEAVNPMFDGRVDIGKLLETKDKIIGWNSIDVVGKLRPTESEAATLKPALKEAWDRDYKNKPHKPFSNLAMVNFTVGVDPTTIEPAQYVTGSAFTFYPYSRGHIHITGSGVADPLDFKTGYFLGPGEVDLEIAAWTYKKQREIFRRSQFYRGDLAVAHPPFPPGSDAACLLVDAPLSDVKDIVYTAEDDVILRKWLRETVATTWHPLGTCKMAPQESLGVVGPNLDVHGVEGLKIVDLSIAPQNVGANTANTAFAIGEKAADILIKELVL